MTNREWLNNLSNEEFAKLLGNMGICALCKHQGKCPVKNTVCRVEVMEWLEEQHKEPIKLSEAERTILENIDKRYKWIARNSTNSLTVYETKPEKGYEYWHGADVNRLFLEAFNHLFKFIKWEDETAYNISELLEE